MNRFPIFYFFFCCVAYCLALPLLIFLSFKDKYKHSIPSRFFLKNFKLNFYPHYWFHACSLGESKSYEPILQSLLTKENDARILLTCTTSTGFAYLSSLAHAYPQNVKVAYLPFEIFLPLWIPFVKHLKTLVITEAELWKMLFWIGKKVGAKTLLVNARISDRSLKSYKRMKWFYSSLFSLVDIVLSQSEVDQKRLENLGAKNVSSFGNLKIFSIPKITHHYPKSRNIILCASSHKNEEKLVLDAFLPLNLDAILIIVPRHPERFNEVQEICQEECKKHGKIFSTYQEAWKDVVLVNAMGELNNFYAIADCVILCGSFEPIGGHNPLEPAFFNTSILSGEYIFNQKALFDLVENALIISSQELSKKLASFDTLPKTQIKDFADKMQDLIAIIQRTKSCKKPTNS